MAPSWRRITRFVPDVLYTITNGASMYLHTIATRLKRGADVEISNQAKRARVRDLDSNDQLSHPKPLVERSAVRTLSHGVALFRVRLAVVSFIFRLTDH